MGTSVTEAQLEIIKKMTDTVVLLMDSDKAGINAMSKLTPAFFAKGINLIICTIDKGMDPADLCLKYNFNYEKVYGIIKSNMEPAGIFLVKNAVSNYEVTVLNERRKALSSALPVINTIQNPIDRELYLNMLYEKLGLSRR